MIYMLFDNPADKKNMVFLNDYETASIQQIYPIQKCNTTREMLTACKFCLKQTAEGDTIICWYDFMAVLCYWLCRVLRKKRKIIALNILLKDKNTIKNRLAKFLYKYALQSNNLRATVTSMKYGEYLNKMLGISVDYILLHDIYHNDYNINYEGDVIQNTVFCGGRNGRDWDLLVQIAKKMPDVIFNCVMPKEKYDLYFKSFSSNMIVKVDVPEIEFLEFMCQSQLVVMPLDTEAPAGLIAFYQAAANGKMVITSNTATTQAYFSNERGVLCDKCIDLWIDEIYFYLQHVDENDNCVKLFRQYLEDNCSEKQYAKKLWEIIA